MIIGITGYARHGKDTCATLIKELYPEKPIEIKHFADPMKKMACEMFGWDMDYIEKNKETVDINYGISPRTFLQLLGTEFAQFMLSEMVPDYATTTGRSIWVKRLLQDCAPTKTTIVPDVRFLHEYHTISQIPDHLIIKVVRKYAINRNHLSEKEIDDIPYDILIENHGSISDMKQQLETKLLPYRNKLPNALSIYISGPISSCENYNYDSFIKAKERLDAKGYKTYNPLDISPISADKTWGDYMRVDIITMLQYCNAIYMLKGWETSKGASLEKLLAEELGIPVYYEERDTL